MCELRKVFKSGSWEGALSHHQLILNLSQLPVTSTITITNFIEQTLFEKSTDLTNFIGS